MSKFVVRYNECDATGYAYNGNFFPWMHFATGEFYRKSGIDTSVLQIPNMSLMTVHQAFDYKAPVRYLDEIEVKVFITNVGNTSIQIECEIYKGEQLVAVGTNVTVWVDLVTREKRMIPEDLREQLNKMTRAKLK